MKRPTGVTVLAIVIAAFGALGLVLTPLSVVSTFFLANTNPILSMAMESTFFKLWILGASALGFAATVVSIAGAWGIWNLKSWGRLVLIIYAIYSIVMLFLGTIVSVIYTVLPTFDVYDTSTPEGAGAIGGAIGGVCGTFCGLLIPIAILIVLNRPEVKASLTD